MLPDFRSLIKLQSHPLTYVLLRLESGFQGKFMLPHSIMLGIERPSAQTVLMVGHDIAQQQHLISTRVASSAPPTSSIPVNSTRRRASIAKQQGDVALKALVSMLQTHVSSVSHVSEVCYKCFIRILQKYIGMLHMLQVFQRHVASVCSKYFICFKRMLQAF